MNTQINYSDIPKEERNHLAARVYRLKPKLRTIRFAAVFIPILFSSMLTELALPNDTSIPVQWAIRLAFALALGAIIWETLGRRRLKAEIEKLKNSSSITTAHRGPSLLGSD